MHPPTRARRRTLPVLAAAVAVGLAALAAPGVAAHDGGTEHDGEYVPPPVQAAPPVNGQFRTTPPSAQHEVWVIDQSNTNPTTNPPTYGGRIHIYDGADLRRDAATAEAEVVELSAATAQLCLEQTGAYPVRPHMAAFNAAQTHAILAFVASGHVVIFNAAERTPVACLRTEVGAGNARQAHAAIPTPDSRYILVANQNGKRVERISTDYATDTYAQQPAATLDLASGTTPLGMPVQTPTDPTIRPDNAPICPYVAPSGFPALISLRGGGLFAIDPYATPMQIVSEYPATQVARDGCGFTEARGWIYGNGGRTAGTLSGWFVYRLPVGGPELYNPQSQPGVQVVQQDSRGPRDAHGVLTVRDRYFWAFDRSAHVLQVFNAESGTPGETINLRSQWTSSPAVDIVGGSPDGFAAYAATRGPNPLSGAHAAAGDAPGVLVLEIRQDGRDAVVRGHARISNVVGGSELADPHGLVVRATS